MTKQKVKDVISSYLKKGFVGVSIEGRGGFMDASYSVYLLSNGITKVEIIEDNYNKGIVVSKKESKVPLDFMKGF